MTKPGVHKGNKRPKQVKINPTPKQSPKKGPGRLFPNHKTEGQARRELETAWSQKRRVGLQSAGYKRPKIKSKRTDSYSETLVDVKEEKKNVKSEGRYLG